MADVETKNPGLSRQPLRLLIIEDNPDDVELTVAVLKRSGYALTFDILDSPESLQQRLLESDHDAILCDHNLRTWTGMDALELLRRSGKDIPFVVATAVLGDEAAVEYIKAGAADYVLKDRLERLPVILGRALREKANRDENARLQQAILCAKKEWELTFDTVSDPVMLLDEECRIQRANRAAAELLGLQFSELIGRRCYEVIHGRSEPLPDCPYQRTRETGREEGRDVEEPRLGKVFRVTTSPLRDRSGVLRGCVHVMHDITERKRGERQLEERTAYLAALVENSPLGIVALDALGRIEMCNSAFERLFQYRKSEAVGARLDDLIVPDDQASEAAKITGSVVSRETVHTLTCRRRKDGTLVDVEVHGVPLVVRGQPVGGYAIYQDVTERRRAEEALRRSEANYRSLVEGAPYGIYRATADGKLLAVNPALVEMLGYQSEAELLAVNLATAVYADPAEQAGLIEQSARTGQIRADEVKWKRKDGKPITVRRSGRQVQDEQGGLLYAEIMAEDVTERKVLEEQLRQAQKMEAIGRLAGGVAHDFNNLLNVIIGYSALALDRLDPGDALYHDLGEIRKAGERSATLVRQLLAFSRKQVLQPVVLDLNAVVSETDKLLRRLIGEDIELRAALGPGLGKVKADLGQIEQVIVNLAVNARDAMPRGGKLTIETSNVDLDESYACQHARVQPGPYVMLAVSDTGCGMDAETQSRIFEPFFTTKEKGSGTGLGLATVYGIVQQSGGHIWVYSEPGRGTTFKVYLPRVEEEEEVRAAGAGKTPARLPPGSETVLLVENEEPLRKLARACLETSGYRVLEASDGASAIEIVEGYHEPIHLMVTDVVMPGLDGKELARRLSAQRPNMRVLYVSGYTDNAIVHHGVLDADTAFLQKPFTPDTLAHKVREVLDESAA